MFILDIVFVLVFILGLVGYILKKHMGKKTKEEKSA